MTQASTIRVLFCDDRRSERESFVRHVERRLAGAFEFEAISSLPGFRKRIQDSLPADVVVTDLDFEMVGGGSRDGLSILRLARNTWPEVELLVHTACSEEMAPDEVLEAADLGLRRKTWVRKIADEPDESWNLIRQILERLEGTIRSRRKAIERSKKDSVTKIRSAAIPFSPAGQEERFDAFLPLIGKSPPMHALFEQIRRVGPTPVSVLVIGEPGTGKELVARALHQVSKRNQGPFGAVSCGELCEETLSSELFGHTRGSFTGADENHPGLIRSVEGGTFLLDEIGELSSAGQVQLLRVLQEREIRPVGSTRSLPIDVRFVATTACDLPEAVRSGRFRADLLSRIETVRIELPKLSDRPQDISLLARHFLFHLAPIYCRSARSIDQTALELLAEHPWPGHVRELEQTLTVTLLQLPLSRSRITPDDVQLNRTKTPEETPNLIQNVLEGQLCMTLPEISRRFGLPAARQVAVKTMRAFQGLPTEEQTRKLFRMSYRNWQHWAHYHGLTWRQVRKQLQS